MLSTIATREMIQEHINEYLGDCTIITLTNDAPLATQETDTVRKL